ncbi:hypothetical protein Tsubulata_050700 [Turnera subulata]|uniref:Demeter RRM-fold domain-containing protein n=1 Tax=Turnera subulata TaxID=218843 RepID=A0A9Q0G3D8_9ROSI|nr:hypothetical protein Tsubulata_050700 [Turnera subulata]
MQQEPVPYQMDRTIIPFNSSSIKQRRPRVNLDQETKRVWKLLLENINSEGVNGTDEEETKWWESERKLYSGFAEKFIEQMHLVQGNRCFSPWKGSVVDSVVGVFLTQNVSHHLSSSTFMSLVAHFPLKRHSKYESCYEERASSVIDNPIVHIPNAEDEWNRETSNQSTYDQNSMTIRIMELDEGDIVNGHKSSKCNTDATEKVGSTMTVVAFGQQTSIIPFPSTIDSTNQVSQQYMLTQGIQEAPKSPKEIGQLCHEIPEDNSSLSREIVNFLQGVSEKEKNQAVTTESDIIEYNDAFKKEKVVNRKATSRGVGQGYALNKKQTALRKAKSRRIGEEIRDDVDWDSVRKQTEGSGQKRERSPNTLDSVDWEGVRSADVEKIAKIIKSRGVNCVLAGRIKVQNIIEKIIIKFIFLINKCADGTTAENSCRISLIGLRDISPDQAKEYLLSINGLGLKSVECVRLLTLYHQAFPVDTNIARIAVRLGWVPLEPLPESLQLYLLEQYPIHESVQKYLWPRLCKFDHKTLYELHYQMITFGKVFCTKREPNCNSCPMREQCKHFASAFASARLSLPWPEENPLEKRQQPEENPALAACQLLESNSWGNDCAPIIEEPLSPEPESIEVLMTDIEDSFCQAFDEDSEEIQVINIRSDKIPSINLDIEGFNQNVWNYMQENMTRMDEMSKALFSHITNSVSCVLCHQYRYELPDDHALLEKFQFDVRDPNDPSKYLLAIWTPGKENSTTVQGTILIPCRTAMRGSFPLIGTYFQVNEVFADHMTSKEPINVPRDSIWHLPRRTVYFGTSTSTIFSG